MTSSAKVEQSRGSGLSESLLKQPSMINEITTVLI